MNKKIAVRMLNDAHNHFETRTGFVCNTLKWYVREKKDNVSEKTFHEYTLTRDNLIQWILLQLRGNETFESYFSCVCPDALWRDTDFSALRRQWITAMIICLKNGDPLNTKPIDTLTF